MCSASRRCPRSVVTPVPAARRTFCGGSSRLGCETNNFLTRRSSSTAGGRRWLRGSFLTADKVGKPYHPRLGLLFAKGQFEGEFSIGDLG
jgi:hypothetical protein